MRSKVPIETKCKRCISKILVATFNFIIQPIACITFYYCWDSFHIPNLGYIHYMVQVELKTIAFQNSV